MLKEAFLVCALALPCDYQSEYALFRHYIEKNYPGLTVIYVHPMERLWKPEYKWTLFFVGEGKRKLRVYLVNRAA